MKKFVLSVCCLLMLGLMSAKAEEGQYLHVKTSTGWSVLDLEKVDRLTFTAANMVASDANGNQVAGYERSSLDQMYFNESSGVETVVADAAAATFSYRNGAAMMLADGMFEVYGVDGALLVSINAKKGETIDISAISQNVVILKSGSYTLKTVLR